MSYREMSDVRNMNDDSTFDADIKFHKASGNTRWILILQIR